VVDVADCGAAYRFLMPVLAATPGMWLLTGTPRLLQRPILPLVEVLRGIGAEIERVGDGWLIRGKTFSSVETHGRASLQCGKTETDNETDAGLSLTLDATQSSQMASALVMAAPLLGLRTLNLTTTDIPSLSYLRMTLALVRDWSVTAVGRNADPPNMTLALARDWPVEIPGVEMPDVPIGAPGDWSAALFWFAHARLHPENEYVLSPLSLESIQGDAVITKWFRMLDVSVSCRDAARVRDAKFCVSTPSCNENAVSKRNENLSTPCIEIIAKPLSEKPRMVLDVRDNLDTVPVMAALAALLPADVTFQNVRNLRYKESDRLEALTEQLAPYAEIELSDNVLRVKGKDGAIVQSRGFETHRDHRLAMAFLLFPGAVLDDVGCLEKSYPGLLEQIKSE
jgi:3-phosphoshikimate 1-carboxyvinyltransferase